MASEGGNTGVSELVKLLLEDRRQWEEASAQTEVELAEEGAWRVFWLLYCCLLWIIIVEFPTFRAWSLTVRINAINVRGWYQVSLVKLHKINAIWMLLLKIAPQTRFTFYQQLLPNLHHTPYKMPHSQVVSRSIFLTAYVTFELLLVLIYSYQLW